MIKPTTGSARTIRVSRAAVDRVCTTGKHETVERTSQQGFKSAQRVSTEQSRATQQQYKTTKPAVRDSRPAAVRVGTVSPVRAFGSSGVRVATGSRELRCSGRTATDRVCTADNTSQPCGSRSSLHNSEARDSRQDWGTSQGRFRDRSQPSLR